MTGLARLTISKLRQILSLSSSSILTDLKPFMELIEQQSLSSDVSATIKNKNRFTRPIQNAIEMVGGLIDTWWVVVSLVTLTLYVTVGAAVFMVLVGLGFAAHAYAERIKDQQAMMFAYQLSQLRLKTVEELILRHKIEMDTPLPPMQQVPLFETPKLKLFGMTFFTSTLVFFSYFYGVNAIIQSLGYLSAAAVMTGPVGIAVAALIGFGLGLYFGYNYYVDKKCSYYLKTEQSMANAKVDAVLQWQTLHALETSSNLPVRTLDVQAGAPLVGSKGRANFMREAARPRCASDPLNSHRSSCS